MKRLTRVAQKLRLRIQLASRVFRSFDDAFGRSIAKVSFSQSGEDLIAWSIFNTLGIALPSYADVGAYHPHHLSNTALFHYLGSRGMNIEPDPLLFAEFPDSRPRDINLNIGIASINGSLTFYRMRDPSLSTFSSTEAQRRVEEYGIAVTSQSEIPVRTIGDVLAEHRFCPDFLSIDVEGQELEILRGFDFEKCRPAVMCVETLSFSTKGDGEKNEELCSHLNQRGYRVYADTLVNTIFVDANLLRGGSWVGFQLRGASAAPV